MNNSIVCEYNSGLYIRNNYANTPIRTEIMTKLVSLKAFGFPDQAYIRAPAYIKPGSYTEQAYIRSPAYKHGNTVY